MNAPIRNLLLLLACTWSHASLRAEERIDYARDVQPVLRERCYACHGALKQKGKLRVDTVAGMRRGGEDGAIVEASEPDRSALLQRVLSKDDDERMPPEGEPLTPEQIAKISAWIASGAPAPADDSPEPDPREHWAFQPPQRPALPTADEQSAAAAHPIDRLLEAARRSRGLTAQPPADRATLLRRLYLDLTGLPPTRAELQAFLRECAGEDAETERRGEGEKSVAAPLSPSLLPSVSPSSPQAEKAYERTVDRLLASPAYGERWGRHWMDVWRYSDWYGLDQQLRNSQKHLWHWRDWIIESLNADKGYDQMIREMLAGDEFAPEDPAVLRATGFLARNYFLFNRNTWLEDTVEHTGKAFLGLTLNCAKCHAHKFDPISQEDFYRFRAIFEPHQVRLDPVPGEIDLEKNGLPRVFDAHADAPTFLLLRGDERTPDKSRPLTPGLPEIFGAALAPQPVKLAPAAFAPTTRETVQRDHLRAAEKKIAEAKADLDRAREALADSEKEKPVAAPASAGATPTVSGTPAHGTAFAPSSTSAPDEARATFTAAEKALAAASLRSAMLSACFAADRARFADPHAAHALELARAAATAEKLHRTAVADEALARAQLNLARKRAAGAPDKIAEAEKKVKEAEAALTAARKAAESPGDAPTGVRVARKAFEAPTEKEDDLPVAFPASSTGRRRALAEWIASPRNPLTARVAVNHIWMRHFGEPLVQNVFDFGRKTPAPDLLPLLDWLAVEFAEHGWSMKHLHRLIVTSAAYRMSSSTAGAPPENRAADPDNRFLWRRPTQRMEAEVVRDSTLHLAGDLDRSLGGPTIAPAKEENSRRRSLYFTRTPEEGHRFLAPFDAPSALDCYRRQESIVPQQALALANSKLTLDAAPKIAAQVTREIGENADDSEFVRAAFETILAATPTAEEQTECERALAELRELHGSKQAADASKRTHAQLVHALLNHNDFVTIR